jgi:hypothetical protein
VFTTTTKYYCRKGGFPMDKNDKKHNDKSNMKKKADKNNKKLNSPQIAGSTTTSSNPGKVKKTY